MSVKRRREEYSDKTRTALLATARHLFARRGYAGTSLDEVARAARLTKGAVYHHFGGKEALFTAVADQLHQEVVTKVAERSMTEPGPWERMVVGIEAFLDACLRPDFRRIILQEAPAVLGYRRWRALDERYGLGLVRQGLSELIDAGVIAPQPLDLLARVLLASLTEAAMTVADAKGNASARAEASRLVIGLLQSLRV